MTGTAERIDTAKPATELTKREYLAVIAMQGLLASRHRWEIGDIAEEAVLHADRLIMELEKDEN